MKYVRHQIEATIRSYREVLLGLFFITIGMLLDVGLLLRHFPLVAAILVGKAIPLMELDPPNTLPCGR